MVERLADGAVVPCWDHGRRANGVGRRHGEDETGGALPGVTVELRGASGAPAVAATDAQGAFRFVGVSAGHYHAAFTLINFATTRRELDVPSSGAARLDAVLHLSLSADVTVTGKRTFANLADVAYPAENLVGIAQSASQGAITARQLDARPIMRVGEVSRQSRVSSSASTAAKARPISTTSAVSTSITGRTSRRRLQACR